jgi:hypothetical protein
MQKFKKYLAFYVEHSLYLWTFLMFVFAYKDDSFFHMGVFFLSFLFLEIAPLLYLMISDLRKAKKLGV